MTLDKGSEMTLTKSTICRRAGQYLAVTTFSIGLAIGSAALANAEFDVEMYDKCIENIGLNDVLNPGPSTIAECCIASGGFITNVPWPPDRACGAPPVNEVMPAPPRTPEDMVSGPTREFNAPDAVVPDAPVIEFPAPAP